MMPMSAKARSFAGGNVAASRPGLAMVLAVLAGLAGCAEAELTSHLAKEMQATWIVSYHSWV